MVGLCIVNTVCGHITYFFVTEIIFVCFRKLEALTKSLDKTAHMLISMRGEQQLCMTGILDSSYSEGTHMSLCLALFS